ncbi:MAG: hypothetical protein QXP43_06775 [Nitrososphaerota archaeon]
MQRTKYAKREEVPDVIVDELSLITGAAAEFVESGGVSGRILIHRRIMRDIRERLRRGDDVAVRELARLRRICAERGIPVELIGDESAGDQFEALAELALRTGASVLTADPFAQKVCEALGADVIRVRIRGEWELDRIFTGNVMSLHLKEGVRPRVKVGTPGKVLTEVTAGLPRPLLVITPFGKTASLSPARSGVFGSVADELLRAGVAPVLVVRPG